MSAVKKAAPFDDVLGAALAAPGVDEVEVRVARAWGGLTRFARSGIHQHVETEDTTVSVRTVLDGRIGTASSNDASPRGAAEAAARAAATARLT
ncbi:MAG: hypothetical protein M3R01_14385, partial [Actinomycetota bacterium]|nr:hypothetical protein [Actinomycetota bacterium]